MTFETYLKDFKNKKFPNIVVMHGEEPYFIDRLEAAIEANALSESEKSFNQTIFYGKESDAMSITDTARRYPMMAERQVVILREAQEMKGLSDLANYIEKPSPTTLLVICHKHKKLDERTKFAKNLKASGALIFESKKIYDNQVADFIINYLAPKKLRIDQVTANLIGAHLGVDLAKIANELDKLALNLPEQTGITAKHVEEYIGISKDYNIFELQKALGTKDILQATKIANYFAVNSKKHPLVMTISGLFAFFLKIWQLKFIETKSENEILAALELRGAWFLKDYSIAAKNYSLPKVSQILSILADFDCRSKGIGSQQAEEELVRELVWLILH
jgi:DNA polymerase III subunit delta